MKISANSVKYKNILEYKNELWIVNKLPEHTKPGKGPAYIQLEMKNLKTGIKVNERFNSSDQVEKAILIQKEYEYLYKDNNFLILMNHDDFEQICVDQEIIKDQLAFLSEGMIVTVEFYQDNPISITLPSTVILEIIETDPTIKGSTVTSSYKPAILSNGVKVKVPPYLETGEKIVIRVEDSTFIERAK